MTNSSSENPKLTKPQELEIEVLSLFDQASDLRPVMSEEDSAYDLVYISEKLAKCSSFMEKLSDIQIKLTKIALGATRANHNGSYLLKLKIEELKASEECEALPRSKRNYWLQQKTVQAKEELNDWNHLNRLVSEVREAVSDRVQMMKRLDSDVRLHQKLLEAKVAAGATSPNSYTGSSERDLELN